MARTVSLPAAAVTPQAGIAPAVDGLTTLSPTGQWVVPPPGTAASPAVSGAAPAYLALDNVSSGTEQFTASATTASGSHVLATGTLAPGTVTDVSGSILASAGFDPIMVRASGAMAVSEDVGPSGGIGVVTMPGIAMAAPIGV